MRVFILTCACVFLLPIGAALAGPSNVTEVWSGVAEFSDEAATNAMAATVREQARSAGVVHPAVYLHPLSEGEAVVTYTVALPAMEPDQRLILSVWTAISDGAKLDDPEHVSDGAGVAVRLGGQQLFRTVLTDFGWEQHVVDLAPWAGQTVELSLVTDCNGEGNASYDWALLGSPVIYLLTGNALEGTRPALGTAGLLLCQYEDAEQGAEVSLTAEGEGPGVRVPLAGRGIVLREFGPAELGKAESFSVASRAATVRDLRVCLFEPELSIAALGGDSAVCFADEPLKVSARVSNTGKAAATPATGAKIRLTPGGEQPITRLDPGESATITWELPAPGRPVVPVTAAVSWGDRQSAPVETGILLLPRAPSLPPGAPSRAETLTLPDGIYILQNPHIRLALLPGPDEAGTPGTGPVLCYARVEGTWRQVASIPPLLPFARLSVDTEGYSVQVTTPPGEGKATLWITAVSAGEEAPRHSEALSYSLDDRARAVEVRQSVSSAVDGRLEKLAGPRVLVGDGATGRKKRMALFPGLEYLEGDEESSSTLDAAPPVNNRLVPDPYKVTIPLMAVETEDALVALMWDQEQKWDGSHMTCAAAFASPNFVDAQANHLMQLFLPAGVDFTEENSLEPRQPAPLQAGQIVTLRQHLLIEPGAKVLDAVDRWFELYGGVPQPQAEPRGFGAELALSRHGFLKTVWDEESGKSRHCVGWDPANAPGFANLLLFDGWISGSSEALDRAELIAAQTLEQDGADGLLSTACCHIMKGQLPFHWGKLQEAYGPMRKQALGARGGQGEDGAWRFHPAPKTQVLGVAGSSELGLCGRPAWALLRHARMTGDKAALQAGLNALEFIEAAFVVPRGAQSWECPLHEPDILASAYGLAAYLEAYRATGEEHYLEQARYWARTGLPFIYMWDDPAKIGMRYATIPVFGTTFFTGSWFGVPVQWCGLVYAYHLQHLARYDKSFPWDRVAAGITVSGMHQQFGDERLELKGTYPDGWYGRFTQRNAPFINPEDIILNRLMMEGYDPGPETAILKVGQEAFHFTTGARIESSRAIGAEGRYRLTYFAGQSSLGFVAEVAAPDAVTVDGRALPAVESLDSVDGGYVYDPAQAALFVKVRHRDGPCELCISGLRRGTPPRPEARSGWDFADGAQGWGSANNCRVKADGGNLKVTVTGEDPYFSGPETSFPAAEHQTVVVRVRATKGEVLGLFWATDARPGFEEAQHVTAALQADGEWQDVVFDLSQHSLWKGEVIRLRLDIEPANVGEGTVVDIDSVQAR